MQDIVLPPPRSRLILERVLGLTALSNAQVAVNPASGELAYAAGCIVVIYNLRRDKQVRYYRVDKTVSCLCFSPSGQFLAIGEKGFEPAITIWDGTDGTLCAELHRHQYGVACMAFSQDGRFLVSVGLVHDQYLYAWELKHKRKDAVRRLEVAAVGCAFVENKILDADYCQAGKFFVTVGAKHFKFWDLDDSGSFRVTGLRMNDLPQLQHRDAVVNAKALATFTGVACGYGSCELKTFAITLDGTLCCVGASGIMERLVSLESKCGNAISVAQAYVAVGGSSGVVRLFLPSTLEYSATLPFPPAFGAANEPLNPVVASLSILYPADPFRYPAVIATRITGSHVIVFYSDRSIFIYGTANVVSITVERSFLYHSGGIRDLQIAGFVRGINSKGKLVYCDGDFHGDVSAHSIPTGTFVTCSDDNTVRLWNLELHRRPGKSSRFELSNSERSEHENWRNPYSQELLRLVYNNSDYEFANENCVVLGGTCSHESSRLVSSPLRGHRWSKGLKTVAVRPDQNEIAFGDQEGNIVVLPMHLKKSIIRIKAHSSKVNCLAYSSLNEDGTIFMASGGQDRLIQVFDCQRGYFVVKTIEPHSAAVTNVSVSCEGKRLLSCGADNTVLHSEIDAKGKVKTSSVLSCKSGKLFDTVLLPDHDTVVACYNNKLEVISVSTGKQQQTHLVGEQRHIALCPAGYCAAMSGSLAEKNIYVIDLRTGESLATGTGHGDAITALKFTPDCRRLLSASSDGCIFVWRLANDIQTEIKARLPRVTEIQPEILAPSHLRNSNYQEMVLPPPAPPISKDLDQKSVGLSGAAPSRVTARKKKPSDSAEADLVAPKNVAKKSSKWIGSRVAVPGPLAAISMEKWMRTKEAAKPTIHVIDEAILLPPEKESTLLALEDEASLLLSKQRATLLPLKGVNLLPSDEDASRNVLVNSMITQQVNDGDLNRVGESPILPGNDNLSGRDELTNLSIKVLDTNTTISNSLALEREHLEKRKRQLFTANAVASMNTRLSQLGFLKSPSKRAIEHPTNLRTAPPQSEQKMFEVVESVLIQAEKSTSFGCPIDRSITSQVVNAITTCSTDVNQLPTNDRMLSIADVNIDLVAADSVISGSDPDSSDFKKSDISSNGVENVTGNFVSQTLRKLDIEELSKPSRVDMEAAASLSVYVSGYGPHDETPKESDDKKDETNDVPQVELNASLSSFTSGFVPPKRLPHVDSMESRILNEPVASSLSKFTTGYEAASSVRSSDAILNVKPNNSIAIAGAQQQFPVDVSLSTFVGGYGVKEPVIDRSMDTENNVRHLTVTSINRSIEVAALDILANLCPPLEEAASNLEKITSGREQCNLNLKEIQQSIEALRSAITSTLNH